MDLQPPIITHTAAILLGAHKNSRSNVLVGGSVDTYPLVMTNIAIENHYF